MIYPVSVQERPLTPTRPTFRTDLPPGLPSRDVLRPPLKWAGGKRWQLPYLRPLWKAHSDRRLVEPFAGGLAVTLGLLPERALINDVNPHLVNFYRWLKRGFRIEEPLHNSRMAYMRSRT